jgi:cytochrome c-type protein NapC
MGPSTSEWLLSRAALVCVASAAAILAWYLIARPPHTRTVKLMLLLGLGVFPIAAATSANVRGFHYMTTRSFCATSCHVMEPFGQDAADPTSRSLPALHSRNAEFGDRSCYVCHSDYGMFGTVTTKLAGLRHAWLYYTEFRSLTLDEALPRIHLRGRFSNRTCMRCHSTELPAWNAVADHKSLAAELNADEVSCASTGCHGPAHRFAGKNAPAESRL